MYIQSLSLENFYSYHGRESFSFSPGFNLILGRNGHGKTKCIEAFEWLFDEKTTGSKESLICRKTLINSPINTSFRVGVTIEIKDGNNLTRFSRYFNVYITEAGPNERAVPRFTTSSVQFDTEIEGPDGSRYMGDDSDKMLEALFPRMIRTYSLFKGESELRKLEGQGTLDELVNTFSDGKHYKKLAVHAKWMSEKAAAEVEQFSRTVTKNKRQYEILTTKIDDLKKRIALSEKRIDDLNSEKFKLDTEIDKVVQFSENAEVLKIINAGIEKEEEKRARLKSQLVENYVENLFDDFWILNGFARIQETYKEFVTSLERRKRQEENDYQVARGIKIGQQVGTKTGTVPLPPNVPTRHYMEEMIREHICKVCNRPAPEGSEPYTYMVSRLNDYHNMLAQSESALLESQSDMLFHNNYIQELLRELDHLERNTDLVDGATQRYDDRIRLNQRIYEDLTEIDASIEEANNKKSHLFEQVGANEDKLLNMATNYKSWLEQTKSNTRHLTSETKVLNDLKEELEEHMVERRKIDNLEGDKRLLAIQRLMDQMLNIVEQTRQRKFEESLDIIEKRANTILNSINVDSFTGRIKLTTTRLSKGPSISVNLVDINDDEIEAPNESLKTTVHISVLHAISEMAGQVKESSYPVIMDAPISSFDERKKALFLDHIASLGGTQRIILLKDLLKEHAETGKMELAPEFHEIRSKKAFMLKLREPFVKDDVSTLSTQVIEL